MGFDLVDITAKRAELTPEHVAFIDALSGRMITYAELDDRASRLAGVFSARGIAAEDRVAILCRNRIEFFEALFAVAKLGAILVPLNWRMPAAELGPLVADCAPKLLLFGREDDAIARVLVQTPGGSIGLDDDYETLLAETAPHVGERRWRGDAIWTLLYTSGTTGQPKGVIQTVQMSMVNYVNVAQAFGLRGGDRTLNFLPLFHAAGIQLLTLPTLIAGGTVTILPGFDAARVLELLPHLDLMFAVPAAYQQLALEPGFDAADFAHVRNWGCGGAPLPDVLVERYAAKGAYVQNGYGMTETGPTAFVATQADALTKIGSVGRPQILLDVRIVDADGRDVLEGEAGEVWMRGPGVTPGYWRRPDETAKAFDAEGWLKSGDLGKRDAAGCYYVVGRIKEMFISGGENVYPAEIENVLARHPAVLEAAVIGIADEKWGEVGHAFVQLRPGASPPSNVDLTQFCRDALAGYKTPKGFTIVDDFPRTAAGKVRKHLLTAPPTPMAR
ncbi:O-succinylbenzoic acid--CoA ligase [alpha proteobacterium U9-1i]|nr:O-succinylbenzoic acid--CoA ligase [alpha proteobacterium U9-1i]